VPPLLRTMRSALITHGPRVADVPALVTGAHPSPPTAANPQGSGRGSRVHSPSTHHAGSHHPDSLGWPPARVLLPVDASIRLSTQPRARRDPGQASSGQISRQVRGIEIAAPSASGDQLSRSARSYRPLSPFLA